MDEASEAILKRTRSKLGLTLLICRSLLWLCRSWSAVTSNQLPSQGPATFCRLLLTLEWRPLSFSVLSSSFLSLCHLLFSFCLFFVPLPTLRVLAGRLTCFIFPPLHFSGSPFQFSSPLQRVQRWARAVPLSLCSGSKQGEEGAALKAQDEREKKKQTSKQLPPLPPPLSKIAFSISVMAGME